MCAIYGYVGFQEDGLLKRMAMRLRHRGPDGEKHFGTDGVWLGHTRLAIVDPEGGSQPFFDETGEVALVANAEIYNHQALRGPLEKKGHRFRSKSDCEVLVHLYEEKKMEFLQSVNGMFAIALWDSHKRRLVLARDRLGIRPLYYVQTSEGLLFASEMKALLESKRVKRELNRTAVDQYLSSRYTWGEKTFFNPIKRLLPAHTLIWQDGKVAIQRYWDMTQQEQEIFPNSDEEIEERFGALLEESVQMRLMSDVPVGLFLSGGIDSALITALVKKVSSKIVRTFSIGFGDVDDERAASRQVAEMLGTQHHEEVFSARSLDLLPQAVWHLDEPVGDSIILPIFHLAAQASKSVKVILTGEGIDELLGGYVHHRSIYFLESVLSRLPQRWVTQILSGWVDRLPVGLLDLFFHYPASAGREGKYRLKAYLKDYAHAGKAMSHFGALFGIDRRKELYHPKWLDTLEESRQEEESLHESLNGAKGRQRVEKLIQLEMQNWLPDYTLHKQDKLLMAHSIEGRVPYLDHRLVQFAMHLPLHWKFRGLKDKYLLRKYAAKSLPPSVAQRKKHAFFLPLEAEYGRRFFALCDHFLSSERVKAREMFNYRQVHELIRRARGGSLLLTKQVMALLILEIWMRLYKDEDQTLLNAEGFK